MRIQLILFLISVSYLGKAQIDSINYSENKIFNRNSFKIIEENEPQFPGGDKAMIDFIDNNLVYPSIALDSGKGGVVKIRFMVDTTGELRDIVVVNNQKKLGFGLEEAAFDIIYKMPKWIPGTQNGILASLPVTVSVQIGHPSNQNSLSYNDSILTSKDRMPDNVFLISTIKPQFPGGKEEMIDFISKTLIYPKQALDNKIQGTVNLKFIIDSTGKICCIDIIGEPIGFGLEKEAIRILKAMPLWTPASMDGMPVAVYYRLPVNFRYYEE